MIVPGRRPSVLAKPSRANNEFKNIELKVQSD
jgi:hypothetical protein